MNQRIFQFASARLYALIVVAFGAFAAPASRAVSAAGPALSEIPEGCIIITRPGSSGQTCVDAFQMTTYEITVAQFRAFVDSTQYRTDAELNNGGLQGCASEELGAWEYRAQRSWRDPGFVQTPQHPVVCVSWQDTLVYANWLSEQTGKRYRLPTEAQWIRAARGEDGQRSLESVAASTRCRVGNVRDRAARLTWFPMDFHDCDDGEDYTAAVGSYPRGPFGLHDLLGNVWEWTCSAYSDIGVDEVASCDLDDKNRLKVLRGASWFDPPANAHINVRLPVAPYERNAATGFRLVVEAQP